MLKHVASEMGIQPPFLCELEKGKRHWHEHHVRAYLKAINGK